MAHSTAKERYRQLLEQLKAEFEQREKKVHGWKEWAADLLDIRGEYVGMLLTDPKRGAGRQTIERAIKKLGIRSEFFYDAALREPRFRDFTGKKASTPEPTLVREAGADYGAHLDEEDERALWGFLGSGVRAPIDADEVERLRAWARGSHRKGALTVNDYAEALDLMRTTREPPPDRTPPEKPDGTDPRAVGKQRAEQQGGMPVRRRKEK